MRFTYKVRGLSVLALCALIACVDLSAGTSGNGGGGGGKDDEDEGLDASTLTLQGAGCGTDATTGITLCLAVNVCPDIVFDADLWPGCGFRLGPAGFDLQCVCDDQLCPIGTPTTCEQIPTLLAQQSQLMVCAGAAEGRCVRPTPGATNETPTTPRCDRACAQACGGEYGCLEQCGCT